MLQRELAEASTEHPAERRNRSRSRRFDLGGTSLGRSDVGRAPFIGALAGEASQAWIVLVL